MRGIFGSVFLVAAVGCGLNDGRSVSSVQDDESAREFVFVSDHTPVDGLRISVDMNPTSNGYRIAVVSYNPWTDSSDTTLQGSGYGCTAEDDLSRVKCVSTFDGPIVEITARLRNTGLYRISVRTSYLDQETGEIIEELDQLGHDFRLMPQIPDHGGPDGRICTAVAGVLVHPLTGECATFSNGCQMHDLEQRGYVEPAANQCTNL
jgi:hypothetical protein